MGCRAASFGALGRCLKQFCANQTWEGLRDVLGFAKTVLVAPDRRGRLRAQTLAREVDRRASLLGTSDFGTLWTMTEPKRALGRSKHIRREEPQDLAERAQGESFCRTVQKLVGEGAFSKACKHLLSKGVHDSTDPEVQAKLRDLHPTSPSPNLEALHMENVPHLPWDTSAEGDEERLRALLALITHFPPGTAGGPSGLKPSHLKECVQDANSGLWWTP